MVSDGLRSVVVQGSVEAVASALRATLDRRGIRVFATIDHAALARAAGLELADEVVVLFGNPAVGTAIMQDQPDAGYDLPLRVLVRDDAGRTLFAYRDPAGLVETYGLMGSAAATVEKLSALLAQLGDEVAGGE